MKYAVFIAIVILLFATACNSNRNATDQQKDTEMHGASFEVDHSLPLIDGKTLHTRIKHSDTTALIPESAVLIMLNTDTLLSKTYYGHMRPLEPASFGITNPIPTEAEVVAAYGAEFAETGSFVYLEKQSGNYVLREIKTSPKDGEGMEIHSYPIK